jgi:hypothetical protein
VVAAAFAAATAQAQWQPNLRIVYDDCGQRSLAWDPVPGAAPGSVTYRVHRCTNAGNCVCSNSAQWAAGNIAGWTLLGSTTDLQRSDLPAPASSYAVSCSADPTVGFAGSDGRWGGPMQVVVAPTNFVVPPGRTIGIQATVRSATQPVTYRFRRNGQIISEGTASSLTYQVAANDQGAVLSLETSNACESMTTPIGTIVFPVLPSSTGGLQWLEYERRSQATSNGRQLVYGSNWCGAPPFCESFASASDAFQYQPTTELSGSGFAWGVTTSRFCNGCIGGGTCGSCQPYSYSESAASVNAKLLLSHHHVLALQRTMFNGWQVQVLHNGSVVYAPSPWSDQNCPGSGCTPMNVQLGLGPGIVEIRTWASPELMWSGCGGNCAPMVQFSCSRGGNLTGTIHSRIRVPQDVPTLRAAVDAAPEGFPFEIELGPGVHEGPIALNGRPVSIRGAGVGQTIIQLPPGSTGASVVRLAAEPSTARISALTIRGGGTGSPLSPGSGIMVGGGVFATGSAVTFADVAFESNAAGYGGAVYALESSLRFERCTFRNNDAQQDGGGILVFRGTASLTDCVIEDNDAGHRGGGMHVVGGSGHQLLQTDLIGNASEGTVGALSWVPYGDAGASISVRECEVRQNSAQVAHGGIGIDPDANGPSMSIQATIACDNSPGPNIVGPFVDLGGNTLCACPSDLNGDGAVDGNDLGLLLAAWGPCGRSACAPDINDDGVVDGADLGALLNDWVGCE